MGCADIKDASSCHDIEAHSQKERSLTDKAHTGVTNLVDIKACMA